MSKEKSCVVYVLRHARSTVGSRALYKAQQRALEHDLPLAVVYCLETWNEAILDELRPVEVQLSKKNIPLIVLIGAEAKTLSGFIYHTAPLQVIDGTSMEQSGQKLVVHPHKWPGVVIAIDELVTLQAAGKITC